MLSFLTSRPEHIDKITQTDKVDLEEEFIKFAQEYKAQQCPAREHKQESKIDATMAEKVEHVLQDFERKREAYNQTLYNLKEELKADIDKLFDELVRIVTPVINETDNILEDGISEFKRLIQRKNEINDIRRKLSPVIEALARSD